MLVRSSSFLQQKFKGIIYVKGSVSNDSKASAIKLFSLLNQPYLHASSWLIDVNLFITGDIMFYLALIFSPCHCHGNEFK